jgi:hypothetical protein
MEEKDWAAQKAKEVREKKERAHVEKQARLLDEKQRSEAAPQLWREFVNKVSERVKVFNAEIGEETLLFRQSLTNKIEVGTPGFASQITAEFDSRLFIRCHLISTSVEFYVAVLHGQVTLSTSGFGSSRQGEAIRMDSAVEQFLNSIIAAL